MKIELAAANWDIDRDDFKNYQFPLSIACSYIGIIYLLFNVDVLLNLGLPRLSQSECKEL